MRARCLVLVGLVVLAAGPASAQRLSVNPYSGLGFATSAPPDLCKMSTSGVDADARNTARHVAEAPGSPPQLELNNCHLHAVADSFAVSSPSTSPCHPDHEPPNGNCGRPLVEWCDNPCTTNACGQTGCLSAQCPVILTTHEVLAPSWSYTFPLNAASSHELVIDAAHQLKQLRGNCTCTTYSTPACPPPPPPPIDDDPPPDDGAPPLRPNPHCNDHEGMPCSPNTPGGSGGNDGGPPLDDDRDGYDETVDPDDRNPNVTPGSGDPDSVTGDVGNDYGDSEGSICFPQKRSCCLPTDRGSRFVPCRLVIGFHPRRVPPSSLPCTETCVRNAGSHSTGARLS